MGRPEIPLDEDCPRHLRQLAEEMRTIRTASGLNLKQLAVETHYTQSALSRATRGRQLPAKRLVLAFVKACGAPNLETWGDIWDEVKQADVRYRETLAMVNEAAELPGVGANAPLRMEMLPDLLRKHRLAAGLTQAELAYKAGLTENSINLLERGTRRRPMTHTIDALAHALGLGPDEVDQLFLVAKAPRALHPDRDEATEVEVYAPTISLLLQRAETPEDLVEAIRALGQRAGRTSLRKMAEVSSVTKSTIQEWLAAKSRPTQLDDLVIGLGATSSEQRHFAQCMERVWSQSKPVLVPAPAGPVYSHELSSQYGGHCYLLTIALYDRSLISGMVEARRLPEGVLGISVSPFHSMGAQEVAAIPTLRRRSTFSVGIWVETRNVAAGMSLDLNMLMTTSQGERPWFEHLRVQMPPVPRFVSPRPEGPAAALRRTMPEHRDDKPVPKSTHPGVTVVRRPEPESQVASRAEEGRGKHRRPRKGLLGKFFPGRG